MGSEEARLAGARNNSFTALRLSDAPDNGFVGRFIDDQWRCHNGVCHRRLHYQREFNARAEAHRVTGAGAHGNQP